MRILRLPLLLFAALIVSVTACSEPSPETGTPAAIDDRASADDQLPQSEVVRPVDSEGSSTRTGSGPRVVFLGTSLTEGLGLSRPSDEAWPALVGELASANGIEIEVLNSGLSGETSAGAVRRLDWVLRQEPDVLVVETGANDGLRALPTEQLEANLDAIVTRVREEHPGTEIVLAQMEAPPNLGADYQTAFRDAYSTVAERHGIRLIPFLLEGVAGIERLNQSDGIHPTPEGHRIMADNAWPTIRDAIRP